jgi:N-acetylglutamate synthase-like GNAT family acetyltransferase
MHEGKRMIHVPTIRTANANDIPAVARLLREHGENFDERSWSTIPGCRYLLVLDAPDRGLAAAAQLALERGRGHLAMLAVADRFEGTGLEDRIIAVVEAMCRAFGAAALDVPPRRAA